MDGEGYTLAEEVIRLLAAATSAVRLYPPSSPMPAEAAGKFRSRANEATNAAGPLKYVVDPHGFRIGEDGIAEGNNQVTVLAETLHSMQVGQLVIAPDLEDADIIGFLSVSTSETTAIRSQGIRNALAEAGVNRIAAIPVTLRASEEEGILGLDLAIAPLDEIGREAYAAAEKWSSSAAEGQGVDDLKTAVDRLDQATRDIATSRVAEALLQLDEHSRMRILAHALRADSSSSHMSGMLGVLAKMNPSALARLLRVVASQANADPNRLATALELPPELAEQIAKLLRPSPKTEAECGVPAAIDTATMADDVNTPDDTTDLDRQVSLSPPALATGRALATTVAISRQHPTEETVEALGQALPSAAKDGAFVPVREALRRLDEMSSDPALALAIEEAHGKLADPEVLADVVRAPMTDADAAIAGEILASAGTNGADVLLTYYFEANEHTRSLLKPVLRGMGEPLLTVASRRIRKDDAETASAILKVMPILGDKRAIAVIAQGLEHLDAGVRRAAVRALGDTPGDAGQDALVKSLGHWDPETRRDVIREIGRVKATKATGSLLRILGDINVFERNHELKKEVIKCLESLGSADALPVLRKWAKRRFVFGRKNKELRFLAQRAIVNLTESEDVAKG